VRNAVAASIVSRRVSRRRVHYIDVCVCVCVCTRTHGRGADVIYHARTVYKRTENGRLSIASPTTSLSSLLRSCTMTTHKRAAVPSSDTSCVNNSRVFFPPYFFSSVQYNVGRLHVPVEDNVRFPHDDETDGSRV